MKKPLLALLVLSALVGACATSRGPGGQRFSDLDRALAVAVSGAEHELLKEGRCTWRIYVRCADGFALASGGKHRNQTEYFNARGDWVGSETNEACRFPERKGCRRCEQPKAEFLCPRALARLRRVEATIRFGATELPLSEHTEVDATDFGGVVAFETNATRPILLTVTQIKPGVELRAFPFFDDGFLQEPSAEQAARVELGKPIPLPALIYVNGHASVFAAKSKYSPLTNPHPDPLPKGEGD